MHTATVVIFAIQNGKLHVAAKKCRPRIIAFGVLCQLKPTNSSVCDAAGFAFHGEGTTFKQAATQTQESSAHDRSVLGSEILAQNVEHTGVFHDAIEVVFRERRIKAT